MSLRKSLLAAGVAIMALSSTAMAGDTKRVLANEEMDQVTAGVSFILLLQGRGFFAQFAEPGVPDDAFEVGCEGPCSPFIFEVFSFNFKLPTTASSNRAVARIR